MSILHTVLKSVSFILISLLIYGIISLLFMLATADYTPPVKKHLKKIYLYHDFAHTEIILPGTELSAPLAGVLAPWIPSYREGFVAFSYGDARFMAYTPSWSDLNPLLALKALFINTPGAIRVGHYGALRDDPSIITVAIDAGRVEKLQHAILGTFRIENGTLSPLYLPHLSYIHYFAARHPYNLFYTCNQWTAQILRSADLPAPRWAPFAFEAVYAFVK